MLLAITDIQKNNLNCRFKLEPLAFYHIRFVVNYYEIVVDIIFFFFLRWEMIFLINMKHNIVRPVINGYKHEQQIATSYP